MTRQQRIARKAVATRRARNTFEKKYGVDTYDVVSSLCAGHSTDRIIQNMPWLGSKTIGAYAANLTRGTYDAYLGGCNF